MIAAIYCRVLNETKSKSEDRQTVKGPHPFNVITGPANAFLEKTK